MTTDTTKPCSLCRTPTTTDSPERCGLCDDCWNEVLELDSLPETY